MKVYEACWFVGYLACYSLCLPNSCRAERTVEYDAYHHRFIHEAPSAVKEGEFVNLHVVNINILLYDVVINGVSVPRFLDSRDLGVLERTLGSGGPTEKLPEKSDVGQLLAPGGTTDGPDAIIAGLAVLESLRPELERVALSDSREPDSIADAADKLWDASGVPGGKAHSSGEGLLDLACALRRIEDNRRKDQGSCRSYAQAP